MKLSAAQADRRRRADKALDRWADDLLDTVGITEGIVLGTANVSPADREKLKGILKRLSTKAHPFTQCMEDLRKNQPGWSDDRRKKTCNVLKQLIGRKNGGNKSATNAAVVDSGSACVLIDDGVGRLLELADVSKLQEEA